ncbi:Alpha/Beta hydrolase protein [Entophlyctis helioformis]|nr:Alpha/Beta hydrolase protein [Entophlyctis helioformis]
MLLMITRRSQGRLLAAALVSSPAPHAHQSALPAASPAAASPNACGLSDSPRMRPSLPTSRSSLHASVLVFSPARPFSTSSAPLSASPSSSSTGSNNSGNSDSSTGMRYRSSHPDAASFAVAGERYRAPCNPVVLCHGLFGFDVLGPDSMPFLQLKYWRGIYDALADLGCKVHISRVGSVSSLTTRARQLHDNLDRNLAGQTVNLIGHSMGGLDGRYVIAHIPSSSYKIASLTTVATPHRGSSFMDWCRDTLGVGKLEKYARKHSDDVVVSSIFDRLSDAPEQAHQPAQQHQPSSSSAPQSSQTPRTLHRFMHRDSILRALSLQSMSSSSTSSPSSSSASLSINGLFSMSSSDDRDSRQEYQQQQQQQQQPHHASRHAEPQSQHKQQQPYHHSKHNSPYRQPVAKLNPLLRAVCSPLDAPAFTNLTREYCDNFNRVTPNDPSVFYSSYAAITDFNRLAPLAFSHQIVQALEGPNDGLVSLESAKWGEFMGTVDCDHWDLVPPKVRAFTGGLAKPKFDSRGFYLRIVTELADRGL